jgi:hypothetical protein
MDEVPFTLEQFKAFCQTHDLLAPAFDTQSRMRTIMLGPKFWSQACRRRKAMEAEYALKNEFQLKLRDTEK